MSDQHRYHIDDIFGEVHIHRTPQTRRFNGGASWAPHYMRSPTLIPGSGQWESTVETGLHSGEASFNVSERYIALSADKYIADSC